MIQLWKAFKEQVSILADIPSWWCVSVCFVNWIHYQALIYVERYER
jgi:hypothetical protein